MRWGRWWIGPRRTLHNLAGFLATCIAGRQYHIASSSHLVALAWESLRFLQETPAPIAAPARIAVGSANCYSTAVPASVREPSASKCLLAASSVILQSSGPLPASVVLDLKYFKGLTWARHYHDAGAYRNCCTPAYYRQT
jgi:hypothetical protein